MWRHRTAALLFALASSSCLYSRILYYGVPTLSAPTYFASRRVRATSPSPLRARDRDVEIGVTDSRHASYASFDALLEDNHTGSFLVVRDDVIVYERYFDRVTRATQLPSFSMSKTFAALLVGCAVHDGVLRSMEDHLVDYVPELASKKGYGEITLDELLRMTSGIDYVEESFDGGALYYTKDLRARMYAYDVKYRPGTRYVYAGLGVQLLWDAMSRRLGGKTVARYFEEALWGPIGAEYDAAFSLDSESSGVEKLFGGFSATTRDHARIGLLFLHGGVMDGRAVLPEAWVRESLTLDPVAGVVETTDGRVRRGKYQWFWTLDGRSYFAKGYLGQYVWVIPDLHVVMVRFGEDYGDVDWPSLFARVADGLPDDKAREPAP